MRLFHCSIMALVFVAGVANFTLAAPFDFDNPGDVTLSAVQAPGTWYTDRFAPAGFASGQVAPDGLTGTLRHSISSGDFQNPGIGNFFNTQGRKYDFAPGLTSAFVQMYVPGSYNSITQSDGRFGSLWATGVNNANAVTAFPIIEFNNNVDGLSTNGFRVWDGDVGWINVGGFAGYDQWYEVGFSLTGTQFNFFVNGVQVFTDTNIAGTTNFSNLILQGVNRGNSYDIFWDNLSPNGQPMPEPASMIAWGLIMGVGAAGYRLRKRTPVVA